MHSGSWVRLAFPVKCARSWKHLQVEQYRVLLAATSDCTRRYVFFGQSLSHSATEDHFEWLADWHVWFEWLSGTSGIT